MRASYPKWLLRIIGAYLSRPQLYAIQAIVNHLRLGGWMRAHRFEFPLVVPDKWQVFDTVVEQVRDQPVLYMEFGVYRGKTTRYWSEKLRHPDARLHGFDSFEGLPETWANHPKGMIFNSRGQLPDIGDPRVRFFKGWFDQVLPTYTVPPHSRLVLIMDADLYSSTACVLRHLSPYIKAGTLIYFDDLNHVDHEPRAFDEFMVDTGLRFKPVCADRTLTHCFFECIGNGGPDSVSDAAVAFQTITSEQLDASS